MDNTPADNGYVIFISFGVLLSICLMLFFAPRIKNLILQLFIPLSSIKDNYNSILKNQSNYYNKLSFDEKDEFIKRVYFFLRGKKIWGVDGLTIGDTEKLCIAATAVQLTFGLERNKFPDFNRILVHPDAYDSPIDHLSHRGDTIEDGLVQLSWKYYMQGNEIPDDGMNLGLHEMSHALELEKMIIGTSFTGSFANAYKNWEKAADKEIISMRQTHKGFIRSYAAVNLDEFFACCIEVFFEKPTEFKETLPDLYQKTCLMLRQDPARNIFRLNGKNLAPSFPK